MFRKKQLFLHLISHRFTPRFKHTSPPHFSGTSFAAYSNNLNRIFRIVSPHFSGTIFAKHFIPSPHISSTHPSLFTKLPPPFQTRIPAYFLARFLQSTSITNSSFIGTVFAEYRILIFNPASQHLWHDFCRFFLNF